MAVKERAVSLDVRFATLYVAEVALLRGPSFALSVSHDWYDRQRSCIRAGLQGNQP